MFRYHFSTQLGFSKNDRDAHVKRVGWIAAEITKHRGIAICALIAPYEDARQAVRAAITQHGNFIEIYVATPLATCEARDPKGLYQKARAKIIHNFTGIDDPYEPPTSAELVINTESKSITDCIDFIMDKLQALGYLIPEQNTTTKEAKSDLAAPVASEMYL